MADADTSMQVWRVQIGQRKPYRTTSPRPSPGPDELLVKLLAMGVCHSDCTILALDQGLQGWKSDFILGHEGAGEVVEVGAQANNASHDGSEHFAIGDRVAIHIIPGCGSAACPECSRGLRRLCRAPGSGNYGLGQDGMFAEFVAVKREAAVKVPAGVSSAAAAIAPDAVLTAYHAVRFAADVQREHVVLIFGLGGLGLNALQIARHLGVGRVLVCDRRQQAVDAAVALGVPREDAFCVGAPGAKPVEAVVAERGIVVDTVIDFVGHEQTVASAQLCVRPAGLIVLVGLFGQQTPLIPLVVVCNTVNIKGTYNGTLEGLRDCLDLLDKGVVRPEIATGSIEDLPAVLDDLDEGKIKGRMVLLPTWTR